MHKVFPLLLSTLALTMTAPVIAQQSASTIEDLCDAAATGNTQLIKTVLAKQVNVNGKNHKAWTPLHTAAYFNQPQAIALLVKANASLNARSKNGHTPVHFAATKGHGESLVFLLVAGASATERDYQGNTALLSAANARHKNNVELISLLLAAGCTANDYNNGGWTALHCAALNCQADVVRILLKAQADPNIQETGNGRTPLHFVSAYEGSSRHEITETFRALLEGGADTTVRDHEGKSALFLAAQEGHAEAIPLFVAAKALLNDQDEAGDTPLIAAARGGHVATVQALIAAGADVALRNNRKQTVFDCIPKAYSAQSWKQFINDCIKNT